MVFRPCVLIGILMLMLVMIPAAFGLSDGAADWFQAGNVNVRKGDDNGFFAYSSSLANIYNGSNLTEMNYTLCYLPFSSITEPVAYNVDDDDFNRVETAIITETRIDFYDVSCNLVTSLDVNTSTQPVVTNFGGDDSLLEITILARTPSQSKVQSWEYDPDSDSWSNIWNMPLGGNFTGLFACDSGASVIKICMGINATGSDLVLMNYTANTSTIVDGSASGLGCSVNTANCVSSVGHVLVDDWKTYSTLYFPYCDGMGGSDGPKCYFYKPNGDIVGSWSNVITGGTQIANMKTESFSATVGNIQRMMYHSILDYNSIGYKFFSVMTSISGSVFISKGSTTNKTSNWVVGDYSKSGPQMACRLVNYSATQSAVLECFNQVGALGFTEDYSSVMNFTATIVMADFNSSESVLGLGSAEGIMYPGYRMYSTGISSPFSPTIDTSRYRGTMALVSSPGSQSPIMIYTDPDYSFIITNTIVASQCGDDTCQETESEYSCPVDCQNLSTSGAECLISSDCPDVYPICSHNKCVYIKDFNGTTIACFNSDNCPTANPFCLNSVCVNGAASGVLNGISGIGGTTEEVEITDAITLFNYLSMGDARMKLFLFVVYMLAGLLMISKAIKSVFLQILASLLLTILGVYGFGLIPWVVMGIIAAFIFLFILYKTQLSSGSSGG